MLVLTHVKSYHGPNPLSDEPVILVDVRLPRDELLAFSAALSSLTLLTADWYLPPEVGPDKPFDEIQLGLFLADWALQALTFARGYLVSAGCRRQIPGLRPQIWLGFHDVSLSRMALALAARSLNQLVDGQLRDSVFSSDLSALWQHCRSRHPDYQARIIMEAARQQGVPCRPAWGLSRHWQFGEGANSRTFFETSSCADGAFGSRIAGSKFQTKQVLATLGLVTPDFTLVADEDGLAQAIKRVGLPCVVKPIDCGQGKGVSANLSNLEEARQAFQIARSFSRAPIMVEAFVPGNDYRLMVVSGRLRAVIRRDPPHVVGDGQRTVAQLVAAKNVGRDIRSPVRSRFMWPIKLDGSARVFLAGQRVSVNTVLGAGQKIFVRSNGNLSTGGDCTDVTDVVHPDIRIMAETLAQSLNLQMMGADYQTADISKSPQQMAGGFIEINTTPGFSAMTAAGWSAEKAGALALDGDIGGISKLLLVVPASCVASAESELMALSRQPGVGWASYGRAGVGGVPLAISAPEPWSGVRALLAHRTVERCAIVVTARELYNDGLPAAGFDRMLLCDATLAEEWMHLLGRHTRDYEVIEGFDPSSLRSRLLQ